MREIKYAVWNDIDKIMIDWSTLKAVPVFFVNVIKGRVKHHHLIQYTGRSLDGVEVYESGILLADGDSFPAVVVFDEGSLSWSAQCYHLGRPNKLIGLDEYIRSRSLASKSPVKVVGNIHENPEILNAR